jgi:hypothetical protein
MTNLQDSEPFPWKRAKRKDPTPAELRLGTAALRFAEADKALRAHEGPRSGPEYANKVQAREDAWGALLGAFWGFPVGEGRSFEDNHNG